MAGARDRIAVADALPLAASAALAALVALWLDPWREPILGDRAYFIYLGQAILRGEPIYANTFFGYPPLTPLLSAGAMWIGRAFGVPTFLAPRFAGIAVYVGCVALSYTVARHATRSARAGALASAVMAGFSLLAALSLANLEPKILLILFSLAAAAALQHARPGLAGLACGLAGMCWQPAILVAAASFAVVLQGAGSRRAPAVARYALGMAIGLVPAALYLWTSDGFADFWQRAIVLPASGQGSEPPTGSWWLVVTQYYWPAERPFLLAAAIGFAGFALRSPWRRPRALVATWLSPSMAGMPLLAPLWVAWNSLDFQGPPDLLPLLTTVPFWTAWLASGLFRGLDRWPRAAPWTSALLLAVAGGYALGDTLLHRPGISLAEERRVVAEILAPVARDESLVSFEVSELYVLGERASPLGFLSLNAGFERAAAAHADGCAGVRERVRALRPRVIAFNDHPYQSRCVRSLARAARRSGHRERTLVLPWWRHRSYRPDDAESDPIRWQVYTRMRE